MSTRSTEIDKLYDCVVINLKKQPERLQDFVIRNTMTGLKFTVFEGIDGRNPANDELRGCDFIAPDVVNYTPGALGNALSHRKLWERCERSGRPVIVFEDDAWIRADFRSVLAEMPAVSQSDSVILLGYNCDSILNIKGFDLITFARPHPSPEDLRAFIGISAPVGIYRVRNAFGSCGYIVSPVGARKLLSTCFPLEDRIIKHIGVRAYTLDCMMNDIYRSISAWACFPPLVLTSNDPLRRTRCAGLALLGDHAELRSRPRTS